MGVKNANLVNKEFVLGYYWKVKAFLSNSIIHCSFFDNLTYFLSKCTTKRRK